MNQTLLPASAVLKKKIEKSQGPCVMGVLNVTPDSFYAQSRIVDLDDVRARAENMVADGAAILDIGGESTRPGSVPVSLEEEIERVIPVVRTIRRALPEAAISVDTSKMEVIRQAVEEGADMLNDVTALRGDSGMLSFVARTGLPVVLMHMHGNPRTMQAAPHYPRGVISEIIQFFVDRIEAIQLYGISHQQLWIDPGIGFGKTLAHNLEILSRLKAFKVLGIPLVLGVSRKSFISQILGGAPPEERLEGTLASCLWAVSQGARILRVHDVQAVTRALRVWNSISAGERKVQEDD